MNIRTYQTLNVERDAILFPECGGWTPADWLTALVGELGEAANLQKKIHRGDEIPFADLEMEIGDMFSYFCLWAESLGVDLETAAIKAYNKVLDRKGSDMRRLDDLRREDRT